MSDSNYQDAFGLGSKILALEDANKLRIGVDGYSNIDEWSRRLSWLLKASFGEYAMVVAARKIPPDWINAPRGPTKAEEALMSSAELETALSEYREKISKMNGWRRAKARIIPHILENLTKASLDRILERDKEAFETAVGNDEVLKVLTMRTGTKIEMLRKKQRYASTSPICRSRSDPERNFQSIR